MKKKNKHKIKMQRKMMKMRITLMTKKKNIEKRRKKNTHDEEEEVGRIVKQSLQEKGNSRRLAKEICTEKQEYEKQKEKL